MKQDDKAYQTMNHANRTMLYYDSRPEQVAADGGVDTVIAEMKARLGRRNIREMIAWEVRHEIEDDTFKTVKADWDYQAALASFKERHKPVPVPEEFYATGQRGRAEGVAEYLNQTGTPVEVVYLPDNERHRGRRFVVVEKIQPTTLRAVS